MQYKTTYRHYRLLIKPSLDLITKEEFYVVWQCGFTRNGLQPIAGQGKYPNAAQALADFKRSR
ncbi:hypothetical protein CAL7716_107640 (plasmid) [Calothrix sp. PCC 7716]|nr:hypothetical protein CAL7716_107640 [Calothrix sp. PCC 7716]